MKQNFFEKFVLIFLIFSLILPEITLAENFEEISLEEINKYLQLPEKDAKNLLDSLVQNFKNQWIDIESSPDFIPEDGLILLLLEKAIKRDIFTYFLIDIPFETTEKIIKYAIKIGQIFISQDLAIIFDEIEKESVKRAVDYGTKKLLENEIRITPGTLTLQYLSFSGQKEVVFQYLVIYKPIDSKHGKVEIRFYSPTSIEPPKSTWAFPHEVSGNLPPFIVEVSGSLENFKWVEKPMVRISFPESVPDLGISPLSFWDKNIIEPMRNESNETKIVLNKFFRKSKQDAEKIKKWFENTLAEIRDKALHLAAQVISFTQFRKKEDIMGSEIETTKSELGKLKEEISYFEEKLKVEESLEKELKEKYESDLNEISNEVNDFTARLDTFSQQIDEFNKIQTKKSSEESNKPKSEEATETETEETIFCQRKDGDLPKINRIIFNEVSWMGTENSSNDEWIELKNISGSEISLAGWQILDKDGHIQIIFSSGELFSANGFYLLERTDDDSVPNVSANKIYTGAFNDTNETLYLFNENCELEDEVLANPNWPAGDKNSKRTMERKSDLSWQTSSNIDGTPKSQNSSGYFFVSGGGGGSTGGGGGGTSSGSGGSSSGGGGGTTSTPTYCSQENLTASAHQLIINEVAWMGTSASSTNEWIELKNISANEINLTGWQLLDKDKEIKIIFSSGELFSANSFYLLERTDDNSVPGILADKIYTGNLEDSNESLRLFDQNCNLIDEAIANPNWPAGDKDEKRSMERSGDLNQQTYSGIGENGILGTPKAENSQPPPAQPQPTETIIPATNLIISEVQISDNEFVELYNPTDSPINLGNFYFSYFTSQRDWNNPYRNWQFPEGTNISARDYYLIGIFGYPDIDWEILTQEGKTYSVSQLNDDAGSLAIFSCDPKNTEENPKTVEESIACKIDALGWDETIIKETESTNPAPAEKSLARKMGITNEGYLVYSDSDNNQTDFEIQEPTPGKQNKHSYSDLDGDLIIDPFDPETIVNEKITLDAGEYNFKNLIIEEGGNLILNSNLSLSGFKGVKIKAENLTLNENSLISADGTGYLVEEGPGSGKESQTGGGGCSGYNICWFGSGGGYGGIGGQGSYSSCGAVIDGGISFGDLEIPIDLGSGGGGDTAGAGGGTIQIEVTNTLTLNGQISANGDDGQVLGACGGSGGGSGGSIYIIANTIEGSGQIRADGGQGHDNLGGGGSGGRIAIYYNSKDSFTGTSQVFGGTGFKPGGPGTIFLKSSTQTSGDLIIDNNNFDGATQFAENYTFDNLKILNSSRLYLPENLTATNLEIGNNSILESLNTATIDSNQLSFSQNSFLFGPSQIFITINSDNFLLQSESKIIANVEINTGDILIDSTSVILADGKGYLGGQGPGAGKEGETSGGGCSGYSYCWFGSGGGYGGQGGEGDYPGCVLPISGGLSYGSEETPIDFGSGGGIQGGAGGGVIKINAINNFALNGSLSVDGEEGKVFSGCGGSGGGSGGSIYITTNIFEGSGQIRADGGQGYDGLGGGGAGGRIAIYFQTNNFQGIIQVEGGAAGYQAGQDGTIFP